MCDGNCKSDLYLPEMATVIKSEKMTEMERFFEFTLDSGSELGHMPGQFAEMSIPGIGEAPISVSSSPTQSGSFEMVVRNVGNVSNAMHGLEAGAKIGIRGPYGTCFPVADVMKGKDLIFLCGGIGLVPVRSVINYVLDNRADYGKVTILFGCRTPSERLFVDELEKWAASDDIEFQETVDIADDSWTGNEGVITTLMPDLDVDPDNTIAIVCGPPVMYKFVLMELQTHKVPETSTYISLERHMKCGVGKCGHCQIDDKYVCQDGPVFNYADVEEKREALA